MDKVLLYGLFIRINRTRYVYKKIFQQFLTAEKIIFVVWRKNLHAPVLSHKAANVSGNLARQITAPAERIWSGSVLSARGGGAAAGV